MPSTNFKISLPIIKIFYKPINTVTLNDQKAPVAFTAESVMTTGGTIVPEILNSTNTGLDIVVPISNDESLKTKSQSP